VFSPISIRSKITNPKAFIDNGFNPVGDLGEMNSHIFLIRKIKSFEIHLSPNFFFLTRKYVNIGHRNHQLLKTMIITAFFMVIYLVISGDFVHD